MFRNSFIKTIYTKRWGLITWSVGLAAVVVFTMIFYPTLSKSFSQALTNVPDSLKSFVGDANSYKTIAGYTDVQIYTQYVFMTFIYGIVLFTSLIAGEENDGTLQTLLAQPVKRSRIYIEKLLAGMVLTLGICVFITIGVIIGAALVHESIGLGRLTVSTLALWLITLNFSIFSYTLGAITGKRGFAGGLAGGIAFLGLLISSLADSVKALKVADKFSPFHYFNKPGILQYGPHWDQLLILAAISAVLAAVGYVFFLRRDIYQR